MSYSRYFGERLTFKKQMAIIFAIASAFILAGGLAYHHRYQQVIKKDASDLLSSIRHFKTEQILFWRADRINDTNSLLDSPVLSVYLNRLGASPGDARLKAQMTARLENYLKHNRYRSALLAWNDGKILVSAGEAPKELHPETKSLIAKAEASANPELGDFYLDEDGRPRLDLASRAAAAPGAKKLFLVLEIAPEDYLYPLIEKWPTSTSTGEVTLSRQEGDEMLALNEIRLAPGSALRKRSPLRNDLPAVKAVRGETGIVFGTDYRGEKVIASVGMIPGTGWAIVAKLDWQEVAAGAGMVSALILLFTLFMLLSAAALAYMLFRLQEAGFERRLDEAESEKEKYKFNFETLSDKANDMILLADIRDRALVMVNQKACQGYGYTQEEMLRLKPEHLIPPENLPRFDERFKALRKGVALLYETIHVKKTGERFPIEISATGLSQGGRDLVYFICRDITERKRLETELKDKERTLASLMYNLPGMAYRSKNDPHWTMEFVSRGCEKLTGYKPVELLGNDAISYSGLIIPEDRDMVWRKVQTALNADRPYQFIYRIRRKDGGICTVWEQGNGVKGPDGAVVALEGLIIDNTEKAAAVEALADSQTRYKQLFNAMEEGFSIHEIICDEQGRPSDYRFLEVNPAFERLTGLKRDSVLGRRALEVLPGLERLWIEKYGAVALTGVPNHFENYSAELRRWYDVSVFSPRKGQFAVTFFDITDRKHAEGKLAAAAEEWVTTFNSIDDVIWVLDNEHRIIHANSATEKVLGKTAREVTGRHCWEIVHGTTEAIEGCPVTRSLRSGRRETMAYVIGEKFFDVTADPVIGPDGGRLGSVHVLRETTAARQAELRMESLNHELAKNLRLYTILGQINQAAAQIKKRDKLFERVCEIAVKTGGFNMAWIGYPDRDTGRVLPLAFSQAAGDGHEPVRLFLAEGAASKGPTGRAAAGGDIALCQDVEQDTAAGPWKEKAAAMGYRSCAAIPLHNGEKLNALLTLYSEHRDAFSGEETPLLGSIQSELSLAIEAISSEDQRAETQAALERTAAHLTHAMEATPIVLFTMRLAGGRVIPQWVTGNPKAITGNDPDEILSPDWFEGALHPQDRARVLKDAAAVPEKGIITHDFRLKKKDGTGYVWVHSTVKASTEAPGEITGSWTDITQLKEAELNCRATLDKGAKPPKAAD